MLLNKVLMPMLFALIACTRKRHHSASVDLLTKRPRIDGKYLDTTIAVQHELQILEEQAATNFGNSDATHLLFQHLLRCTNEQSKTFRFLFYNLQADPYFQVNSKSCMELAIERGHYRIVHAFLQRGSRPAVVANLDFFQKAAESHYWRVLEVLSSHQYLPISESYTDPLSLTGLLLSLHSYHLDFSDKIIAAINEIINHELFYLFHWLFYHRIDPSLVYSQWLNHAAESCVIKRSIVGLRELHAASRNHRDRQTTAFLSAIDQVALAGDLELFESIKSLCKFPYNQWISHWSIFLPQQLPNFELWSFMQRVLTQDELSNVVARMLNSNGSDNLMNSYSSILSWNFPTLEKFNDLLTRAMSRAIMDQNVKAVLAIISAISHHSLSFRIAHVRKFIIMAHDSQSPSVVNSLLTVPLTDQDIRLVMPGFLEFAFHNIFDQRCITIAFTHLSTADLLNLHTKAALRQNLYWKTCSRLLKYRQSLLSDDELAQIQINKLIYNPLRGMTRVLHSLAKLPLMNVYQTALLEQMTVLPSNTIIHEDCPICLLPMDASSATKPVVSLNHDFRHQFHARCILTHLVTSHSKCPICRHHIRRRSYSPAQRRLAIMHYTQRHD